MPAPIVIEITPRGRAVIAKLQRFPQDMAAAIKRGMDSAGNTAWRDITLKRFSGKGPFPPLLHRLGEVSERTKQALMWKAAQVNTVGNQVSVTGTMGVFGVAYFPQHETGNSFRYTMRSHRILFGQKVRPRVEVTRKVPKRAPLRTGLESHKINFQKKIEAELEKEWAKK